MFILGFTAGGGTSVYVYVQCMCVALCGSAHDMYSMRAGRQMMVVKEQEDPTMSHGSCTWVCIVPLTVRV